MNVKHLLLSWVAMLSLTSGCGEPVPAPVSPPTDDGGSNLSTTVDHTHPVFLGRPLDTAFRTELFSDLASRCAAAGGTFRDDACDCGTERNFRSALVRGKTSAVLGASACAPLRPLRATTPTFTERLQAEGPTGLAGHLGVLGVKFAFAGDDTTLQSLATRTAQWADDRKFYLLNTPLGSRFFHSAQQGEEAPLGAPDGLTVYVGKPSAGTLRTLVSQTLERYQIAYDPLDLKEGPFFYRNHTGIVEPEPTALGSVLGTYGEWAQPPGLAAPPVDGFPEGSEERVLAQALITAHGRVLTGSVPFVQGQSLVGQGCMGICRLVSAPTSVQEGQLTFRLDRLYVYGTVARETVWLEQGARLRGFLVLGPTRGPGLLALVRDSITTTSAKSTYRVHDRQWTHLGDVSYEEVPPAWAAAPRSVLGNAPTRRHTLVLCEATGMPSLMADATLARRTLLGPYPPEFDANGALSRGSLFGWLGGMSVEPNPGDYLHGLVPGMWGFRTLDSDAGALVSTHAADVARTAMAQADEMLPAGSSEGQLLVAPMGTQTCLVPGRWLSRLTRYTRVVNASYSYRFPFERCSDSEDYAFGETSSSLLWVMSAGNSDRPDGTLACPTKRLAGRDNGIVVAGLAGESLGQGSNYGATFADIAAPWYAEGRPGVTGTSYASPRVAAVAAMLASSYDRLEPKELRMAILAGSRPLSSLQSAVRSGGALDAVAADTFAYCLQDALVSSGTRTPAIYIDCAREAGATSGRVTFLQSRGILPMSSTP
ncbi:S8 family serine peptidase [Archangium violaceum]|uniref:S8 family serine peptidase n=1 Tax=Archangium violaceum TaxID=83451 RepID=UPI0036DDF550